MNLRVRLIVAFFLLSVVPIGALTFYGYTSNAEALRAAARREAELLAGELSQRMQVVTGQLTERVERLVELSNAQEAAAMNASAAASASAATATAAEASATDSEAATLGQLAMLLNNVQVTGRRGLGRGGAGGRGGFQGGGGGRRRSPPPSATAPPTTPVVAPGAAPSPVPGAPPGPAPGAIADSSASGPGDGPPPFPGEGRRFRGDRGGPPPDGGRGGGRGNRSGGPPPGPADGPVDALAPDGIRINMVPIRDRILQQYASPEEWAKLSEAERQRIMGEVRQQMLGVELGINVTKEEVQKRVAEAQRVAAEKAKEAAAAVEAKRPAAAAKTGQATPAALRKTTTLSGSRLDVRMERNGEVVQQANAEINLPNLLSTVFSTTRRDSGEVPFAVAKDGHIYTPTADDTAKIAALGNATKPETPPGTTVQQDWIIVTVADPTGAGLKFGIARPVGDSLKELQRTAVRNATFGMGFIALALVGIIPLSGRLTRNLSTLSDAVHRIAQGDYRARVPVRSKDEIGKLALAFNQMAEDVERHQRAAVGQERIKRELELGRQIQHDMLPHVPLRLGLTEVKGVSVPAREVGGDFFNYFQVTEGKVALLVGDVSGKGVGAALLMANIQASLRTRLALGQDLASLASEIDTELGSSTPGAVYATLFVAMLDLATHELRYVNAGHNPQFVLRGGGGLEGMPSTGMPIGLMAGHGFTERRVQVAPGDVLFFYTDGCVETENETGEMFGTERLEAALKSTIASGAEDVLAYVETEVTKFRGITEPFDDATMMAVKVG